MLCAAGPGPLQALCPVPAGCSALAPLLCELLGWLLGGGLSSAGCLWCNRDPPQGPPCHMWGTSPWPLPAPCPAPWPPLQGWSLRFPRFPPSPGQGGAGGAGEGFLCSLRVLRGSTSPVPVLWGSVTGWPPCCPPSCIRVWGHRGSFRVPGGLQDSSVWGQGERGSARGSPLPGGCMWGAAGPHPLLHGRSPNPICGAETPGPPPPLSQWLCSLSCTLCLGWGLQGGLGVQLEL